MLPCPPGDGLFVDVSHDHIDPIRPHATRPEPAPGQLPGSAAPDPAARAGLLPGCSPPHSTEEFLAEMAAPAWNWYVRLALRGKDVTRFPAAVASYAAWSVG